MPLRWQPFVCVKMATKFYNFMNENVRALKDALEKLKTRKIASRILTGILSNNSEISSSQIQF